MNLADLKIPFPPESISWRVGSTNGDKTKGMALAYIDARDVQDRLDAVCGIDGWQCRYVPMHDKKTVCEIGIRVSRAIGGSTLGSVVEFTSEWIWKADGAGDSDIEAEKGALSDAFKRAAVRFGIGRYLYDLDSPWVALEASGRSFKIAAGEHVKLRALLSKDASKAPAVAQPSPPKFDPDPDGQATNWVNLQKGLIAKFDRLPDLLMWEDEMEAHMKKLLRKSPELHKDLRAFYQAKFQELSK